MKLTMYVGIFFGLFCISPVRAADSRLAWRMHHFGVKQSLDSAPSSMVRMIRELERDNNCRMSAFNRVLLDKRFAGYEALLYCDEGPIPFVGAYFDRREMFLASLGFGTD